MTTTKNKQAKWSMKSLHQTSIKEGDYIYFPLYGGMVEGRVMPSASGIAKSRICLSNSKDPLYYPTKRYLVGVPPYGFRELIFRTKSETYNKTEEVNQIDIWAPITKVELLEPVEIMVKVWEE